MDIIFHIDIKKLDSTYEKAINEYFKRTSSFTNIKKILYKDFSSIELKKGSYRIAVSYGNKTISSVELAKKISDINLSGYSCIEFLISDNMENIYSMETNDNTEILHLTTVKLNADIAAVALAEQIYRAYTINNNIRYHK